MPSPLRPFDKLRHRVDWSALAPYVSNLTIQLDPCLDGTAGLKELVRQANGRKIRSVYPKYLVKSTFTDGGVPAQLAIEYVNSEKKELEVLGKTFYEITEELYDVAESIKLADELVGDVREVFSNSDDRI